MSGSDAFSLRPAFPSLSRQSHLPIHRIIAESPANQHISHNKHRSSNSVATCADKNEYDGWTGFFACTAWCWRGRASSAAREKAMRIRVGTRLARRIFPLPAVGLMGLGGATSVGAQAPPPAPQPLPAAQPVSPAIPAE